MDDYSVVMCVYSKDKAEYFKEAIESVLNQTIITNDLIIVCDGPIDKKLNREITNYQNKYKDIIKVIKLAKNKGLGNAMNVGINNCKNSIIGKMDSDDISAKNRFEVEVKYLLDNKLDIVGSYIEEINNNGKRTSMVRDVPQSQFAIRKNIKYRSPINHPTIVFRKEIFQKYKYEDFSLFEDYYQFFKLLKFNCKIENVPEVLVYMRADNEMYKRRGGLIYIKKYVKFLNKIYKEKYINIFEYIFSLIIRVPVMLLPTRIRKLFYYTFLRKK